MLNCASNKEQEIDPLYSGETARAAFRLDFTLATLDFAGNTLLFELPNYLRCEIRSIDNARGEFEARENYGARRPGSNYAIEALLSIPDAPKPEWQKLRIGYPVSELQPGEELSLQFDGHALQLFSNGILLNEDYVCSAIKAAPRQVKKVSPILQYVRFGTTLLERNNSYPRTVTSPIHLWSPSYLNAWVGDTSTFTYKGVYHLFYLFDRRHHASKGGTGGHAWAHLTSRDLKSWRDDGVVIELKNFYETFGTGTPFPLNGQLALAYGLHSYRVTDRTMITMLHEKIDPSGNLAECDFSDGKPLIPEGATYALSADGHHFTPSRKLFHWTENPSVFQLPNGRYRLFCGNTNKPQIWETSQWGSFHKISSGFPPCEEQSFSGNNLDCPSYFTWHGNHYCLVGFSGMWMARDENFSNAIDLTERGEDLYDGLCVPMVSPHPGDPERRILAAWLPLNGAWGGVLGMRELVFHSDGVLGSRHLAEAMPGAGSCAPAVPEDGNFYFETELDRACAIKFEGAKKAAEFRFDPVQGKAQLCFAESPEVQTIRERALSGVKNIVLPRGGFAVGKLRLPAYTPTQVRLLIRYSHKWGGTIIDAEIASCRTLIVFFAGLKVQHISGENGVIRKLAPQNNTIPDNRQAAEDQQ